MPIYNNFSQIIIDDARIDETCNAYFKWKDLNTYISNNSHRGINMPDAISEPMACYCLGYLWNRGNEVGDATDPNTGKKLSLRQHLGLMVTYHRSDLKHNSIILFSYASNWMKICFTFTI